MYDKIQTVMKYPEHLVKYKFKKGQKAWNKGIDSSCEKICEICGKPFRVSPSRINKRFRCSRECYGKSKQKIPFNGLKTCNTCKETFEATTSNFFRDKRTACGLSRNCKKCHTIRSREWGKQNPERLKERTRNYMRKHRIGQNGKDIRRIKNKRSYPIDKCCEICKEQVRLIYHHWDNSDFSKGMWICNKCHFAAHWLEKYDPQIFYFLKHQLSQ